MTWTAIAKVVDVSRAPEGVLVTAVAKAGDITETGAPVLAFNTEGDMARVKIEIFCRDNPGIEVDDVMYVNGHFTAKPVAPEIPVATPDAPASPSPDAGDPSAAAQADVTADAAVPADVAVAPQAAEPVAAAGAADPTSPPDAAVETPVVVQTSYPASDPANAPEAPATPTE